MEVFNTDNSELPDNDVISLLKDGNGGIWAGTYEGGLVHRFADGSWEIFNHDNSDLPAGRINSLISDYWFELELPKDKLNEFGH